MSQIKVIARNLSRETTLCTRGEVLAVVASNVRTSLDIANQAIIAYTLSKYRVYVACLSKILISDLDF